MFFYTRFRVAFARVSPCERVVEVPFHGVGDEPVHLFLAGVWREVTGRIVEEPVRRLAVASWHPVGVACLFTHGENVGAHHRVGERVVSIDYIFTVHADVVVVCGEREPTLEHFRVEVSRFFFGEFPVFADVVAAASAEE